MLTKDWRDLRIAELEEQVAKLQQEVSSLAALAADGVTIRDRMMLQLILAGAVVNVAKAK